MPDQKRLLLLLGFCVTAACCRPLAGRAETVTVEGNGQSRSVVCAGTDAVVRGNDNRLRLQDRCRSLLLEGSNNQVAVELTQGASLQVRGNGNTIHYQGVGEHDIQISVAGNGDMLTASGDVSLGAGPGAEQGGGAGTATGRGGAMLVLREENSRRQLSCAGQNVLIEGNGDEYTLQGGCRSLTVRGEGLTVRAEMQPATRIIVQGNGDDIAWAVMGGGQAPSTSLDGEGSQIRPWDHRVGASMARTAAAPEPAPAIPERAPPLANMARPAPVPLAPEPPTPEPPAPELPTPEPPAPRRPSEAAVQPAAPSQPRHLRGGKLVLKGDHEARDVDCAGSDVRIQGDYGLFVLRGGCAAITIKGDSNKVQAEIEPGAHITVNGAASTVAYAVIGGGTDAIASVSGAESRVWRIPALGEAAEPRPGAPATAASSPP